MTATNLVLHFMSLEGTLLRLAVGPEPRPATLEFRRRGEWIPSSPFNPLLRAWVHRRIIWRLRFMANLEPDALPLDSSTLRLQFGERTGPIDFWVTALRAGEEETLVVGRATSTTFHVLPENAAARALALTVRQSLAKARAAWQRQGLEWGRRAGLAAIAAATQLGEPGHPQLFEAYVNHAGALGDFGLDDEARPLLERALALVERTPSIHPAWLLRALDLLGRSAQPERAGDFYRRAVKVAEAAFGEESVNAVTAHAMWGGFLLERGRLAEARGALARAEAVATTLFGEDHPLQDATRILGLVQRAAGELDAAAKTLTRALALAERYGLAETRLGATRELAMVEADRGKAADAEALYRRCLVDAPPGPWAQGVVAEAGAALARLLEARGERGEAKAVLERAAEQLAQVRAPEHPDRLAVEQALAALR